MPLGRSPKRRLERRAQHLLEGPGDGPLLRVEAAVEIDVVLILDVPADKSRVGNEFSVVVYIGQLYRAACHWALVETCHVGFVFEPGQLEQHFHLGDERAHIRQPESRFERVKRDRLSPRAAATLLIAGGIIQSLRVGSVAARAPINHGERRNVMSARDNCRR